MLPTLFETREFFIPNLRRCRIFNAFGNDDLDFRHLYYEESGMVDCDKKCEE